MVVRSWRGVAKRDQADAYVRHLQNDTFPLLARIPGFVTAAIWHRDVPIGVEFVIVTHWESIDAIRRFAGEPVDTAVVPPEVRAMMLTCDERVAHYEVVDDGHDLTAMNRS
jgi:heme-degrading monooxygenase HmoA